MMMINMNIWIWYDDNDSNIGDLCKWRRDLIQIIMNDKFNANELFGHGAKNANANAKMLKC